MYAAVFGGAIVAAKNIVIKTVLSLTYGTWVEKDAMVGGTLKSKVKVFSPLVYKGAVLHPDKPSLFTTGTMSHPLGKGSNAGIVIPNDEVLSTVASELDITKRKGEGSGSKAPIYGIYDGVANLVVGESNSEERERASAYYSVRTAVRDDIYFYHKGRRVRVRRTGHDIERGVRRGIPFTQGISVDPSGVATVIITTQGGDFMVNITYEDPKTGTWSTRPQDTKVVSVAEITMDYANRSGDAVISIASTND